MAVRKSSPLRRRRNLQHLGGYGLIALAIVIVGILFTRSGNEGVQAEIVTAHPVVGQFDTIPVPVPLQPVSAGTVLEKVKFRNIDFPAHQIPDGAVLDLQPYLASMAITPLPANLPIFRKNLTGTVSASNPVIERIPDGMRAITIRVDATSAVEGWASSGAIVDVLLVTGEGTDVVAEKVRILSAERSVNPIQNITNPNIPSTVTLLVDQEQCLAINTAVPHGRIAFALRSLGDEGVWAERRFHKDRLRGRGAVSKEHAIKGFFRLEGENPQSFALSGDSWVPTDVEPPRILKGTREG